MPKISELNEITSLYANDYFAVAHDLQGLPSTKKINANNLSLSLMQFAKYANTTFAGVIKVGDGLTIDSNTGILSTTESNGYTGSQGDQGYTGSQGNSGYVGSQGDSGAMGYTGSSGAFAGLGYTGSQGDIGYIGSRGEKGDLGYPGSRGETGITGYTGSSGAAVYMGYTGSAGDIGYTGSQGDRGDRGDIGYTGSLGVGYTGSTGDIGYTGSQGDIGYTGSSGGGASLGNLLVGGTNNDTIENVSGTGNVVIGSAFPWNFDYSGNFNQPIGSYIKSTSVTSIGNPPITVQVSDIVDGPDTNTWVDLPNASPYTNIQAGWIIDSSDVIAPQLITAVQVVDLGGGSSTYRVSGFPSYYSNIDYPLTFNDPSYLPAATAALSVAADSNTWVFNSNGSLSFPDTTTQYTAFNINNPYLWAANQTFLNPTTFSNSVYLTSINANNSFGTSGQVLTTNSTGGVYWSNSSSDTLSSLTVTGNVTSTSGKFIGDGSLLTNLNVTQQANIVGSQANVTLIAGNYSYVFDNTSTFTMPANGDIVLPGVSANLSVGGTITVGGNIIMQNRPAFRVYGAGTTAGLTTTQNGNGVLNNNNWAVDFQQGTALNGSTGYFTAPIAGLYQVNFTARCNSNSGSAEQVVIRKNSGGTITNVIMLEWSSNTSMNHTGGSSIVKLAVGDTLYIQVLLDKINFDANDNWSVAFIG